MSARFSDGAAAVNGREAQMSFLSILCAGLCHLSLLGALSRDEPNRIQDPTPQPPLPLGEEEKETLSFSPSPLGGGGWGVGSSCAEPQRFEFESKHMGTTFRIVL